MGSGVVENPGIDEVRALFAAVLEGDRATLGRIRESAAEVWIENGAFVFSIAGLHALLDPAGRSQLNAFRRMLYASELNEELRARGAEIAIFYDTGKVASNRYCLRAT